MRAHFLFSHAALDPRVRIEESRTGSCLLASNLSGYENQKPTFSVNQNDTRLVMQEETCSRAHQNTHTHTHSLAKQVRPDCGVAQAVIAGQTADQRGNLNLHDVGGKKKKPQTLETSTQRHHAEPQHSNTIH